MHQPIDDTQISISQVVELAESIEKHYPGTIDFKTLLNNAGYTFPRISVTIPAPRYVYE